jgi:hypothetical protein
MSKTNTFTLTITTTGDGISAFTYAPSFSNTAAHGLRGPENVPLTAGWNPLTAPTDTTTPVTHVAIIPSSTSTNTKTLKGVTGDTGIANWTNQLVVAPMASAAAWGINAVAGETVAIIYF